MIKVYKKLQDISTHGPFNCNLKCVDIINEKQNGFHSTYTLQCKLCNVKFYISSDEGSDVDVNISAVLGTIGIGCGYSQMQEFSAALNLPLMGEIVYKKCEERVSDMWEGISFRTMKDAAKEERELALLEGRVDVNGIPIVDVIVDGCWSKRTYKKNYSALSGAAAIIGKRSGKILYLGVKNKYCWICAHAQYRKEEPHIHNCFKNYAGPSTGMESNILVEGYKRSIEMHGLIYGRMISDGDSSTYSKIIAARPYANVTVQKIECQNHIMRNMCNKLTQLKTDTRYPLRCRKQITGKKIIAIRGTIKKAMEKYTSDSESEKRVHVEILYNDILLAHLHGFGDHSRCKTYFCKNTNEKNTMERDFMSSNIWSRICQIVGNVASHAPSLIHNVESNKVESFNSKIAKLVGGKRINFSLKGGYTTRCKGAAISHNTRTLLSQTITHITGLSPKGKAKILEQRRIKRCRAKKYSRKNNILAFSKGEDQNYGENCTREDITPEIMEKEKSTFVNNLKKTEEERQHIERETILQSASSEWLELRRKLLTASNFGRVIKRRSDVSCRNLVKDLLYKDCISHVTSIKHGRDNEKIAIEQLSRQNNIKIEQCGIFLDEKLPYLGASPDGISNNMTVEVKCPISAYKLNFEEAVRKEKVSFFKIQKDGEITVNKNHNWYYQIQGQLHITKKPKCLFGLWLGENIPMRTEIITKDEIWNEVMETKLTRFYWDCILPELIDPRHTRKMTIRDPNYIEEAIKNKTMKKEVVKLKNTGATNKKKISNIKENKENIETEIHKQKTKKRTHDNMPYVMEKNMKKITYEINSDSKVRPEKYIKERKCNEKDIIKVNTNSELDNDFQQSRIIGEEKENIFNSSSYFPKINIQNLGEFSGSEEVNIERRKPLLEKQLNFDEF